MNHQKIVNVLGTFERRGMSLTRQEAFNKVYDTLVEVAPNVEGPTDEILRLMAKLADLVVEASDHGI